MTPKPFFAMPHPGIFRVTATTPFPGLPHVHAYLAEGPDGGLVAIDTTLGWEDSFERFEQSVAWMDRRIEDLETIYITHAHPDHMGMAKRLQEASGAVVVCHPIADRMMQAMLDPGRWEKMVGAFAEHGWQPEGEVRGAPGFALEVPERVRHVEQGERVTFGGSDWDVHWTPGHEWGHIVFFRPTDRLVVVGDTLLGKITPHIGWMEEPEDPLGQFLDSLDLLAGLDPSFVIPGHGRPFEEGAERARVIRSHHEQRLRRIVEILARRGAQPAVEVARELFGRDLMYFAERLALAETLSHLEYLRLRGRVHREMADGLWRYELHRLVP